jgi:hypothetical protein
LHAEKPDNLEILDEPGGEGFASAVDLLLG